MAWVLHFILGMIVGAATGLFLLGKTNSIWMVTDVLPHFILGAALVGGAFGSYNGDKLWLGDNYRCIPPDAPEQSLTSSRCSWCIGLFGGGLMLYSLSYTFLLF